MQKYGLKTSQVLSNHSSVAKSTLHLLNNQSDIE